METNTELSDFYVDYCGERPTVTDFGQDWTLPEPSVDKYTDELINNTKEFSDTAMVVITRIGAETVDLYSDFTFDIPLEDLASFDTHGHGCYVLENGEYTISIRANAHEVIDSVTYTQASDIVYDENNARSSDVTAATNQFQYAEGDITYLSRADGFANYDTATAAPSMELSENLKTTFIKSANYEPESNPNDVMPTLGAKNGVKLAELRGLDYDDPKWDTLLDQLSIEDMNTLISQAGFQTQAIDSVGKVATVDCDGPASINNNFTGVGSVGLPSEVMLGGTWSKGMALIYGQSMGKMADEMDVSGWYAPGVNIHRKPVLLIWTTPTRTPPMPVSTLPATAVCGSAWSGALAACGCWAVSCGSVPTCLKHGRS